MKNFNEHRNHWTLDPEVLFLNHGSFGATPRAVLAYQADLREAMERQPVLFLARELEERADAARDALAEFLSASSRDLAFVPNATTGVNAVLRSLEFSGDDELLVTDHEYGACRNALDYVAGRTGAKVVQVEIPFPLQSEDEVVQRLVDAVTPRTRLALFDHVTSQTGMVLPVQKIVSALQDRGIDSLIDGAHAPGMLDLDVPSIGAAFYTGNCHKWICSPKGAAFLWVREDKRPEVRPLTISHGAKWPTTRRSRYHLEFDWTGTHDPTAYLSVPKAIETMGSFLPGGWPELRTRNRNLALEARRRICRTLSIEPPCPEAMIGSLASFPIPDGGEAEPSSPLYLDPVQVELYRRHRIEVPIAPWPAFPKRLLRISAQLYNTIEEYEALCGGLKEILEEGRRR